VNQNGALSDTASVRTTFDLVSLSRLFGIAGQFALLVLLVRQFEIESRAFFQLSVLAWCGFVVHAILPLKWRLPFFAALSVASILVVLGVEVGLWLFGLGLLLIGLCHLPIDFWKRVVLIAAVASIFALMRAGLLEAPWSGAIWPILGSMFMFRLAIYLYDLRHRKIQPSLARTIGYFFMIPNVCFPLFPVIDYTRFNKHYYDQEDYLIYQRGIEWMFRGIVHLLLYRLIYHNFVLDPSEVNSIGTFVQYSLAAFLLYLRVSGLFHLAVGMLLMFGFNLHETHRLYYFASGFTDFWRRINIYWKDFMMKLFYYPVRFYLRGSGEFTSILIGTLVVFTGTWVLHSYQWFWLRGDVLLEWHDGLFWAILAVLVIVNSLYELKHPPARDLGGRAWTPLRFAITACRTAATFITICLLWSLWSSDSLAQWLSMIGKTGVGGIALFMAPPVLFGVARLLKPLEQRVIKQGGRIQAPPPRTIFWRSVAITATASVALILLRLPAVYTELPTVAVVAIKTAFNTGLNERDKTLLVRGYYEHLMAVNRQNTALRELYSKRPAGWDSFQDTAGWRQRPDFLDGEVRPNLEMSFKGAMLRTNSWGMRDREYALDKPNDVFRIAALGASTVFGSGVEDHQTFESLFESELNRNVVGKAYAGFEVLNFGTPARLGLRQLIALREKVFDFDPDAVFYFAHLQDLTFPINHLSQALRDGKEIPFDYIRQLLVQAGVSRDMLVDDIRIALQPHAHAIARWTYEQIVQDCKARGVAPVWVYLPATNERSATKEAAMLTETARIAGFVVLDLGDIYRGHGQTKLALAEWDNHPNALGHRLLAEGLYRVVHQQQEAVFGRIVLQTAPVATASIQSSK